jgi:uracil-DNA glycosylase
MGDALRTIPGAGWALAQDWQTHLGAEFDQPYMVRLKKFLEDERRKGAVIYPEDSRIFQAMTITCFDTIKVVIIGQDPYHGPDQAHGLAFSVPAGVRIPPSLRNIYKEIEAEYGVKMPPQGDLSGWAEQGVLLLNATLSVEQANAGSHQNKGWEDCTDAIIRVVNEKHSGVVFMLWGAYAQKKGAFIDQKKHLVLEAPHPSPLSAHRGFLGCGHFIKANDYLVSKGRTPIEWQRKA